MQPFQCDLPPQLQETQRTTHTGTATCCKTHRRNNSRQKRPQPQPPHRRGTFHRRLQPLYTEKHKVSCSGFLPTTWPMQHSCSITMRSAIPHQVPIVTTSLPHHFPSSAIPSLLTSLPHHFPSSPPVIITTLHQSQFHCFLFFCYVLLCYVLLCDLPPCIISSRRILFVRNTEVLLPNFL